jgi:hypothetical protein
MKAGGWRFGQGLVHSNQQTRLGERQQATSDRGSPSSHFVLLRHLYAYPLNPFLLCPLQYAFLSKDLMMLHI